MKEGEEEEEEAPLPGDASCLASGTKGADANGDERHHGRPV